MKNWKHWGVKQRRFPEFNYNATWLNLKTLRFGTGVAKELPIDKKEFYDVSLGTKCNCMCDFCYVSATDTGKYFSDICEKAEQFFGKMAPEIRPFQIAIGSTGEPTIHPDFIKFIKTIYDLGICPNYTTNSITLAKDDEYSEELIKVTQKYCGGVAISVNKFTEGHWQKAVRKLIAAGNINVNLHIIISDKASVNKFKEIYDEFSKDVLYFVLLPLMPSGRSTQKYNQEAFKYLLDLMPGFEKIAFGAHFYDDLIENQDKIKVWAYPPESLSANILFDDTIKLTKSSFDLEPVMEIKYERNI